MASSQTIRPAHAVAIQLINAVRKQAPTEQIEAVLKRDATLSFNRLRHINSSGFGLRTGITSFRHAVMILWLPKLFRWALLHQKGPLAPLLELTIACETADDATFARAAQALIPSNHRVNWAHLQALAWAENMT